MAAAGTPGYAMPSTNEIALIVDDPRNKANLDDLLGALGRRAGLIPFVGAGLSRPFGFPEWGAFLREQAKDAGVETEIETRLGNGQYEEAAEDLHDALGALAFEDAIRRTFDSSLLGGRLPDAAVRAVPALAAGPVLTTNFDRVLETVFEEAQSKFDEVVYGAAQPGRVEEAMHVNSCILWKLHGDYKGGADRVLTNREYAEHYGHSDPAQVDWQKPLPRRFETLLSARPVLFLGSSLEQDRTVRILRAFVQRHPGVGHYALVETPVDEERRRQRRKDLSNVAIRPLWFPPGRFDLIGPFLAFLAERYGGVGSRAGIASQNERVKDGVKQAQRAAFAAAAPTAAEPQRVVGDRPESPDYFQGRAQHLTALGQRLASASTRVVTVIGPKGSGKTALVGRVLLDLEQNRWPASVEPSPVDGIAYLSTRGKGITLERVYLACTRLLGGPIGEQLERAWHREPPFGVEERIQLLLDALAAPKVDDRGVRPSFYIVLLDHMEDLLQDGAITDDGIRRFVDGALTPRGGPRLIITSRTRLKLPSHRAKFDDSVNLAEGLSVEEGVALLRALMPGRVGTHTDNESLRRAVSHLGGIPRALEVFAGILTNEPATTVDQLLERFDAGVGGVTNLFRSGIDRLDESSQRVVEALAVYGQPVPAAAVDFLLQPFFPGLDLPAIFDRLSSGQIVRANRGQNTWSLQPMDQDFAYARCPETGRYSRQTLHQRAAEWYARIRPPRDMWTTLEGLEPLLREFEHRVKAGLYDDAAAVLVEFDDEFRGRLGHAARSLEMHLTVQGRITVDRVRMLDALGLAHAYRHVGPLTKAVTAYQEALTMARAQANSVVEIESLGWMGETLRRLGRLDDGAVAVREAVAVSRRAGDRSRVARWLGELALVSCYRGALDEALDSAKEAHATAVEIGDAAWEALAIDALALVHLVRGDPEKAIEAGASAIERYERSEWKETSIYVLNVMGLAYLDLRDVDRAIAHLDRAWREARVCEDIRVEGMTRFNLAHAYRLKPDIDTALAMADGAVLSFSRTGGGELPAAKALAEALRARAAGQAATEARWLLEVARRSIANPDIRYPRDILIDAERLAREAGDAGLAADASRLLTELQLRDARAQPSV
jgi:tetratricopeptide (TPR) repeat protein